MIAMRYQDDKKVGEDNRSKFIRCEEQYYFYSRLLLLELAVYFALVVSRSLSRTMLSQEQVYENVITEQSCRRVVATIASI